MSFKFQLLDDNRELFIAETQEVVKAHSRFMLFATQNPPGQYGGRKVCEMESIQFKIFYKSERLKKIESKRFSTF